MRHILLATDGSESADRATEAAQAGAGHGGRLSILTVEGSVTEDMKQFARVEGNIADAVEELRARS